MGGYIGSMGRSELGAMLSGIRSARKALSSRGGPGGDQLRPGQRMELERLDNRERRVKEQIARTKRSVGRSARRREAILAASRGRSPARLRRMMGADRAPR